MPIKTSSHFYRRGVPNNASFFGNLIFGNYPIVQPQSKIKISYKPIITNVICNEAQPTQIYFTNPIKNISISNFEWSINNQPFQPFVPNQALSPLILTYPFIAFQQYRIQIKIFSFPIYSNNYFFTCIGISPPIIISLAPSFNKLTVNFELGTENAGNTILDVQYSFNQGITFQSFSPPSTNGIGIIPNLINGLTYTVILKSINQYTSSLPSNSQTSTLYLAINALSSNAQSHCVTAFSTLLVNTNYNGALFQIRRSSDNAVSNVYYDISQKIYKLQDNTHFSVWIGPNTAYVTIWYNQINNSNNNNATQTSTSNQPVFDYTNGKITFIRSSNTYLKPTVSLYTQNNFLFSNVFKQGNITIGGIYQYGYNGPNLQTINQFGVESGGINYILFYGINQNPNYQRYNFSVYNKSVISLINNNINLTSYTNNTIISNQILDKSINFSFNNSRIGNFFDGSSEDNFLNGELYSLFTFNIDLSTSDLKTINTYII
jgi:hypothetical protein